MYGIHNINSLEMSHGIAALFWVWRGCKRGQVGERSSQLEWRRSVSNI